MSECSSPSWSASSSPCALLFDCVEHPSDSALRWTVFAFATLDESAVWRMDAPWMARGRRGKPASANGILIRPRKRKDRGLLPCFFGSFFLRVESQKFPAFPREGEWTVRSNPLN